MADAPEEIDPAAEGGPLPKKSGGFNVVDLVRGAVQSSPWFVIAIAAHAVIIAVFFVVKLGDKLGTAEDTAIITTEIGAKKAVEELPPEEKPEELIDRTAIPDNVEAELVPQEVAQLLPQDAPVDPNRDLSQEIGDPNSVSDMPDSDPTGGTSIGVGNEAGHRGSGMPSAFVGRRLGTGLKKGVLPGGPTQGTEEAIRLGLIWLIRHQNDNGSWSAITCKDHCPPDKPCQPETAKSEFGGYTDKLDVGLTSVSLLCFLGAGYGHNAKQFVVDTVKAKKSELGKDVVLKALKWLVAQQQPDGSFGDPSRRALYNDAIAALALSEAYGLTQNRTWKEPAQKAINFLCTAQKNNPKGTGKWGWRYVTPQDIENNRAEYGANEKGYLQDLYDADTSVTGWCVMALKSAMVSGLEVPQESIDGALAFIKWCSTSNGLVGYYAPETAGIDIAGDHAEEYKYHHPAMASVAMCVRIFLEQNIEDPYLKLSADQIVKSLPSAEQDPKAKTKSLIDYYYWYYGSLALNQLDGPDSPKRTNKYWGPWNKAMQDTILSLQSKEEKQCTTGGFLKPDRWSFGFGPIYTTAVNVLTLEVYYRYENAFGAAQNKKMGKKPANKGKGQEEPTATEAAEPDKKKNP
jgi:hypothetical protein